MRISCTTSAARHREAVKARGIAVVLFVAPMLTGCARTVEWDEDVVLNTGESVVVHRMDLYKRRSEPGNPFNFEWWPTSRGYQFQYRGRRFTYKVPRTDSPGALALHRDPDGTISIVDYSRNCQKPGFARWKLRGDEWVVVPNVAAPLHGTARNLMAWQSPDGDIPPHVTAATRARLDAQAHTASHVDELYSLTAASDCTGKR